MTSQVTDLFQMMVEQILNYQIDEIVIESFFDYNSLDLMNASLNFIN